MHNLIFLSLSLFLSTFSGDHPQPRTAGDSGKPVSSLHLEHKAEIESIFFLSVDGKKKKKSLSLKRWKSF